MAKENWKVKKSSKRSLKNHYFIPLIQQVMGIIKPLKQKEEI